MIMEVIDVGNYTVFIRLIEFPAKIKAVTLPNSDMTYDIYINSNLDKWAQETAIQHELEHIIKNHHYNYDCIGHNESDAIMAEIKPKEVLA